MEVGGLGMLRYESGCGTYDNWRHKHSGPAEPGGLGHGRSAYDGML